MTQFSHDGICDIPPWLNLGCGTATQDGWVNVDCVALPAVDITHDLNVYPWPFPDDHFREVRAIDVLEHLDKPHRAIEEIWRVAAPGAIATIRVPHYTGHYAWADPTHRFGWAENVWNFYDPSKAECRERPYYTTARFHIDNVMFEGSWFLRRWSWRWTVAENRTSWLIAVLSKWNGIVQFMTATAKVLK